ncbi:Oidioi.mRNA.OKI2018_I69.chr1.g963.t1.cds [Oikopleura dioica]|uniref:Oidioi.mRNA.OKI2018_I69.chr1.g963.t1.cds n=1 Tax=Oikopleura dioica TaxID=34765 RepID=A0ABN7SSV3_OIKDI|nr:Oidioi.mRNA.OKI2018_I69.chr1.g963.t1.cds [Oikopleura dioica]
MLRKDLIVKIFLLAKLGNAQSGDFQDETIFDNIEVDYKGDTFNTQRSSSKNIFPESSSPEVTEEISELTETIILTEESSSGVEVFDKIIKIEETSAIMEESSLEREPNEMLVIGLGVGIAALMLCLMLIGACVYIRKRRNQPNILSSQNRPKTSTKSKQTHSSESTLLAALFQENPKTRGTVRFRRRAQKAAAKQGRNCRPRIWAPARWEQ